MKGTLKWPLIVAAIIVVLRIITERFGVPDSVNNAISVVLLHTLLVPIYLAVRIARNEVPRPYATLVKLIAMYAVLTRAMVLPVYWLARVYEWTQPRFAGLWGREVTPFVGYIGVPFITAAFWIGASIIGGGLVGAIVLAVGRRLFVR